MRLTSLIPTLDSSGNRSQDNSEVEHSWLLPFIRHLFAKGLAVIFVQLNDAVNLRRTLCNQGAFNQKRQVINEPILVSKMLDVLEKLLFRDADERILNPIR